MHILTAMIRMRQGLAAEDAPERQLQRVNAWHLEIEDAVEAARVCASTVGLDLDVLQRAMNRGTDNEIKPLPFITGARTHKTWLQLCDLIQMALATQRVSAATLHAEARSSVANARSRSEKQAARARAARAWLWKSAAAQAEVTGQWVIQREDALLRPVGEAIRAAGGIHEVARDKYYHQMEGRRR